MSVPAGYKATEAGVIPEDWAVQRLGSVCNLINGRGFKPHEWSDRGLPIIRIQNLNGSPEFNYYSGQFDPKILVRNGELLFAWSGSRGTSFGPHFWCGPNAVLNYHTWKMAVSSAVDRNCLYYVLKQLTREIEDSAHGASALVHTQKREMTEYLIPLPPTIAEQSAIAEALSDMDEAIAAMEAVIAKKRALKTATMQALLSGTRRLPGFSGEWESFAFGSIFQFLRNGSSARAALSSTGAVGYIHYGDIHAAPRPHMDCSKGTLPRISREVVARLPRVHNGDLLIADASEDYEGTGKSVEAINLGNDEVVAGLHTLLMRPIEKMAPGFAGYLQFIPAVKRQYVSAAQGVSVYGLSRSAIKAVEVALPKFAEQQAIASCLMDMEADVSHQVNKRCKLQAIKSGMMQQLLTGKIRLV